MIDPTNHRDLKEELTARMREDRALLDQLRDEIRVLQHGVRRIQPRNSTAVSLVGTDGGNARLQFDPFIVQLIRVVDSKSKQYCLEAITPSTDTELLSDRQFNQDGSPRTVLGKLMAYLGVVDLTDLSPFIPRSGATRAVNPGWVQVYRELVEWATLFHLVREKDFGSDTLIVFDGLLRSIVFGPKHFSNYRRGLLEGIAWQLGERRHMYVVGIAKRSKVLTRYRLAMALEHILDTDYPAYVEVPRDLEEKSYTLSAYARGDDLMQAEGANKYVGGKLHFAKFGPGPRDPIWPVDILTEQLDEAQTVLGYMLSDAINGFPIPYYPLCLQKAHEHAALVDFDVALLQDQIFETLREVLGDEAPLLDIFRLQDTDPAQVRYG